MEIVEIEGYPFVFGEIFDYHYQINGGKDEEKLTDASNLLEDACNYLVKKNGSKTKESDDAICEYLSHLRNYYFVDVTMYTDRYGLRKYLVPTIYRKDE